MMNYADELVLQWKERAETAEKRVKELEGWSQDSEAIDAAIRGVVSDEPNPIERHQAEAEQWKARAEAAEKACQDHMNAIAYLTAQLGDMARRAEATEKAERNDEP